MRRAWSFWVFRTTVTYILSLKQVLRELEVEMVYKKINKV